MHGTNTALAKPLLQEPTHSIITLSPPFDHFPASGVIQQEPYTAVGQPRELCGAANFSQSYSTLWGWADASCDNTFVSVCRMRREQPRRAWSMAA
jgi:hypothetical protein